MKYITKYIVESSLFVIDKKNDIALRISHKEYIVWMLRMSDVHHSISWFLIGCRFIYHWLNWMEKLLSYQEISRTAITHFLSKHYFVIESQLNRETNDTAVVPEWFRHRDIQLTSLSRINIIPLWLSQFETCMPGAIFNDNILNFLMQYVTCDSRRTTRELIAFEKMI